MMGGGKNGDDGKGTCWVRADVPASYTGWVCVGVCARVCIVDEGQAVYKEDLH